VTGDVCRPELTGEKFGDAMFRFDSAILCGILRPPSAEAAARDSRAPSQLLYCPHPDTVIQVLHLCLTPSSDKGSVGREGRGGGLYRTAVFRRATLTSVPSPCAVLRWESQDGDSLLFIAEDRYSFKPGPSRFPSPPSSPGVPGRQPRGAVPLADPRGQPRGTRGPPQAENESPHLLVEARGQEHAGAPGAFLGAR